MSQYWLIRRSNPHAGLCYVSAAYLYEQVVEAVNYIRLVRIAGGLWAGE